MTAGALSWRQLGSWHFAVMNNTAVKGVPAWFTPWQSRLSAIGKSHSRAVRCRHGPKGKDFKADERDADG
jgi:hypothetical protein